MASEIRVDKINSLSGVGTVTLSPTGVDIAGITTAATLRATTGIVTSLTAGSLTSLGAVSGTTGTFSGAVSGTTGTFSDAVSGTTGTFSGAVSGTTGTFSGAISGTTGTFSGAISGTTGTFSGTTTFNDTHLDIADSIRHIGDSDTKIRFPDADTFTVETSGSERLRITSAGLVGIGTDAPENDLHIMDGSATIKLTSTGSGNSTRLILESEADSYGGIHFGDPSDEDVGRIRYYHGGSSPNHMEFSTNATEHMRIHSGGVVSFNSGIELGSGLDATAENTLDDYEEGTFTPNLANVSAPNFEARGGTYTKIGRIVHGTITIGVASGLDTSDGSAFNISGLPFTGQGESCVVTFGRYTNLLGSKATAFRNVRFTQVGIILLEGNNASIDYSECSSSGYLLLSYTYHTN